MRSLGMYKDNRSLVILPYKESTQILSVEKWALMRIGNVGAERCFIISTCATD